MNLTPEDREILRRASDRVLGANAILNFVSEYFRDKYSIPIGGYITPDGEIVSPKLELDSIPDLPCH